MYFWLLAARRFYVQPILAEFDKGALICGRNTLSVLPQTVRQMANGVLPFHASMQASRTHVSSTPLFSEPKRSPCPHPSPPAQLFVCSGFVALRPRANPAGRPPRRPPQGARRPSPRPPHRRTTAARPVVRRPGRPLRVLPAAVRRIRALPVVHGLASAGPAAATVPLTHTRPADASACAFLNMLRVVLG